MVGGSLTSSFPWVIFKFPTICKHFNNQQKRYFNHHGQNEHVARTQGHPRASAVASALPLNELATGTVRGTAQAPSFYRALPHASSPEAVLGFHRHEHT